MTTPSKAKLPRRTPDDMTLANKDEDNSNDQKEYVNYSVDLTFDVLTIIFKRLGSKDLCNVAMVSRSWNEAAQNEMRVRTTVLVALFSELEEMWKNSQHIITQSWIRPVFSLMFTRIFDRGHPVTRNNVSVCPCVALPKRCSNIVVGNSGVIKDGIELEDTPGKAAWILFPHDKDVTIETIGVPIQDKTDNCPPQNQLTEQQILQNLIIGQSKVKCFILLTDENHANPHDVLRHIPRDEARAVAGSAVGNLAVCRRDANGEMCSRSMSWIGIAISGPNVRSWSIVLTKHYDTTHKVVTRLKILKAQVQLRKHSVGFMFACQGRGEYMFGSKNVESTAFKELFPEVPLVGSFGGGEYGDNTVGRVNGRVHQYSTVFMIVTYG